MAEFSTLMARDLDLDLALDRFILHTVMHQSSTSTYISNFIEIEETFCERLLTANFKVT